MRRVRLHLLLPLFAFVGCQDPLDEAPVPSPNVAAQPPQRPHQNPRQYRAEIARSEVPGFAGIVNKGSHLLILMTDTSNGLSARAFAARFQEARGEAPKPVRLQQVRFDYLELLDVYNEIFDNYLGSFRSLGIDEQNNVVVIGVASPAVRQLFEGRLRSRGIPEAAVRISVEDEWVPEGPTLQDRTDNLHGGYRVEAGPAGGCTLGLPVVHSNGSIGVLSASHCSLMPYFPDQGWIYQPSAGVILDTIGSEMVDDTAYHCGPGLTFRCRRSDAAVFRVTAGLRFEAEGIIARVMGSPTFGPKGGPGPINLGKQRPWERFWQVDRLTLVAQGDTVDKMGQETGWTRGVVTDPMRDVQLSNGLILTGQVIANYFSSSGDSGAPVFTLSGSSTVGFVGIHVGQNGKERVLSPIHSIENELGTMDWCFLGSCGV